MGDASPNTTVSAKRKKKAAPMHKAKSASNKLPMGFFTARTLLFGEKYVFCKQLFTKRTKKHRHTGDPMAVLLNKNYKDSSALFSAD